MSIMCLYFLKVIFSKRKLGYYEFWYILFLEIGFIGSDTAAYSVSSYMTYGVCYLQPKKQNELILKTIINNREDWKHNKEFAKIVKKMEKGKSLRKKEFAKIHWFLWNIGH